MASNCCAACKVLRQECTEECIFAPHFPSTQPMKFESVNKIFGAENVANILVNLPPPQRQTAVNSLVYAAEARKRDPITGCLGMVLYHKNIFDSLIEKINSSTNELANCMGPDKVPPFHVTPMPEDFLMSPSSLMSQGQETRDGDGIGTSTHVGTGASTSAGPGASSSAGPSNANV